MPALIFVYGTLKEDFPNFHINRGSRVPGEFVTVRRFPLYLVGVRRVPCVLNSPGEGERVIGQVFEVDAAALQQMDMLEGVHESDGYSRLSIDVVDRDKSSAAAFAAFAYVKRPEQLAAETNRVGPLAEYTVEHASWYVRREG